MSREGALAISFANPDELVIFAVQVRLSGEFSNLLTKMHVGTCEGKPIMFCGLADHDINIAGRLARAADKAEHGVAFIVKGESGASDMEMYANMRDNMHLYDTFFIKRELITLASGVPLADFKTTPPKGA